MTTNNNNNNNNTNVDTTSAKAGEPLVCGCGVRLRLTDSQRTCETCSARFVSIDTETLAAIREWRAAQLRDQELSSNDKLWAFLIRLPVEARMSNYQRTLVEKSWGREWTGKFASQVFPRGSYKRGYSNAKEGDIAFYTRYQLTASQLEVLHKQYPSYYFVTGDEHHDHPISHITTRIASMKLWERVDGEKVKVLDLHGNPQANLKARRKATVHTIVERVTPKDYIRAATKWGDWQDHSDVVFEESMRNISRFPSPEWEERIATYSDFTSIHTLYYYQRDEIASLLSKRKGSRLHAIVHKHTGTSGSLFAGEQQWVRSTIMGRDHITQVNKMTGEQYEHPSLDWLFSGASSWSDDRLGFGWTLSKIAYETYLVTMTGVPVPQTRMDAKLPEALKDSFTDNLEVDVCGTTIPCPLAYMPVVEKAAAVVALKARTGQQFKDHVSYVKRSLKQMDVEDPSVVRDTAILSFFREMQDDKVAMRSLVLSSACRQDLRRTLDGHFTDTAMGLVGVALKGALGLTAIALENANNPRKAGVSAAKWLAEKL